MIEKKWSTDGEQSFYRPEEFTDLPPWINKEKIELIGVSENSVNVTYNKYPDSKILAAFNVTKKHVYCDYYAIEIYDEYDILNISKIFNNILKNENFDLILSGLQSDDMGNGQLGVLLAEHLNMSHGSLVMETNISDSNKIKIKTLI